MSFGLLKRTFRWLVKNCETILIIFLSFTIVCISLTILLVLIPSTLTIDFISILAAIAPIIGIYPIILQVKQTEKIHLEASENELERIYLDLLNTINKDLIHNITYMIRFYKVSGVYEYITTQSSGFKDFDKKEAVRLFGDNCWTHISDLIIQNYDIAIEFAGSYSSDKYVIDAKGIHKNENTDNKIDISLKTIEKPQAIYSVQKKILSKLDEVCFIINKSLSKNSGYLLRLFDIRIKTYIVLSYLDIVNERENRNSSLCYENIVALYQQWVGYQE